MSKEIIEIPVLSPWLKEAGLPIAPVVRANGFIFVSALPPFDLEKKKIVRGTTEEKTEVMMKTLKQILEIAGSSVEKIVKVTAYLDDDKVVVPFRRVYSRHVGDSLPASTIVVAPSRLPGFDLQLECIALA